MNKNKKGQIKGGMAILIVVGLVAIYMFNIGGVQDLFKPEVADDEVPAGRCPSSGLTEITLNVQEALASTATNKNVNYYAYDNGALVKDGETGADGSVSFDLGCAVGKTYTVMVINETAATGSYPEMITVDASGPTDVHNIRVYEFGQAKLSAVGSSVDPAETHNVSGGAGKTCGIVLTFANNESVSGYNKPLIMCQANTTAVSSINWNGVTRADSKAPVRVSADSGFAYWTYELDRMVKSTEGAIKLTGTIEFAASKSPAASSNMTCKIVDQATFKVADYKTLSLSEGFLEAAENIETRAEIGATDSEEFALHLDKGAYC